jgi:hypothetical protein
MILTVAEPEKRSARSAVGAPDQAERFADAEHSVVCW